MEFNIFSRQSSRSERRAKARKMRAKKHADVPFSLRSRRDGRREIRDAIKEKRKERGAQMVYTISFRDYVTHSALVSGVGRSPMVVSVRVDQ